jgi:hypothetical protein
LRGIPLTYVIRGALVAPGGDALYAVAYTPDASERSIVASDPAFLVVLDLNTGAERGRIQLPDLKVGQRKEVGSDGRTEYWTYEPGLQVAPDGNRVYIARAHEPFIDVLDTRGLRVERTVRVETRAGGPIDWLLRLFASSASAKGGPGVSALLAISPDGGKLFTRRYGDGQPSRGGIHVIDTQSWQIATLPSDATNVAPSADGLWLLVRDPPLIHRPGADPAAWATRDWSGGGLRVLDAAGGREAVTLLKDTLPLQIVQYGRDRLYVTIATSAYHGTQPYTPGEVLTELIAFQVGSWRELARRPGHFNQRIATHPG